MAAVSLVLYQAVLGYVEEEASANLLADVDLEVCGWVYWCL